MASAFLDRLYDSVYDYLGDPATTRRLTKAKILSDFDTVEREITNKLLVLGGTESTINRAESTITVEDGVAFYQWPVAFRNFIRMEKRNGGDRNDLTGWYPSIPEHRRGGVGIVVLDSQRGFEIRPTPDIGDDQSWVLVYQKGPILIHNGTAAAVTANTLTLAASPATNGGEIVALDDYYNGSMVHVYSATAGAHQVAEITDYVASTGVLTLRHNWATTPTGTILYEIMPTVPVEYDDIYAIRVAMRNCNRREQARRWANLKRDFDALWEAVKSWALANVSDRPSERVVPDIPYQLDPYDGNN
jgi:hypothetical protein